MADFNASAVREQMARAWWLAIWRQLDVRNGFEPTDEADWLEVDAETRDEWMACAAAALPIAVRAVTDAVRGLHQPLPLTGLWGDCAMGDGECGHEDECPEETRDVCSECDHTVTDEDWQGFKTYPCPTKRLCDEIDKAAGVQR